MPHRAIGPRAHAIGWVVAAVLVAGSSVCSRNETATSHAQKTKASVTADSPRADCELTDLSGRADQVSSPQSLHDPIAEKILQAANGPDGACPRTFAAVQAKLQQTDAHGCDEDMFSAVQTILVSERAQLRRTAEGSTQGCAPDPIAVFRGVTRRVCGGRPAHALLAAVFGLTIHDTELPGNAELVGFDETRGVFNYYSLEGGAWNFHGDSIDMLRGAGEEGKRRCAACHVGGGLVLKELRSPWVFWEGRDTLPGVEQILDAHPDLGSRVDGKVLDLRPAGKELEETIEAGNRAWTRTRVEHVIREGTVRSLLEPLFCTTEIELMAASQSVTPPASTEDEDATLTLEANALLVDPRLGATSRLSIPVAAYHRALASANHRVERACGATLHDRDGKPIVDTAFDLTHPFRSTSDDLVVGELLRRRIVDEGTVAAVLGVDVSRPVFSPTRCGLLELVPEVPAAGRDATWIRKTLLDAATAAATTQTGASRLADYLRGDADPRKDAQRFVQACEGREPGELIEDLLREVSRRRGLARKLPIIEMAEMLPTDDLDVASDGRLDPKTCRFGSPPT